MIALESIEMECVPVKTENVIHMPAGLLGFENVKRFVLLTKPEEAPFSWLQAVGDPTLAFLVVPPAEAVPDYQPDLSDEDVKYLALENPDDALIYNIVTLRQGEATINLKGPIVINKFTLRGKQVVLQNASMWSVRHPLPIADGHNF
ncbi:MAG TPA: flagellar assembly protein FliW [Verrucomicrobiae bacterium]|nr:flagellar assembly protein FliW [Verrucomicrobiae bacterium]